MEFFEGVSKGHHLYVVTVEANWLQIRGNTMMRRAITLAALIMFAAPASARPAACSTIDGAVIVADDGTYLGKVADAYDGKSIFNKYGTHGSPYSGNKIGRASCRDRVCQYE